MKGVGGVLFRSRSGLSLVNRVVDAVPAVQVASATSAPRFSRICECDICVKIVDTP